MIKDLVWSHYQTPQCLSKKSLCYTLCFHLSSGLFEKVVRHCLCVCFHCILHLDTNLILLLNLIFFKYINVQTHVSFLYLADQCH